jgi:hypothetical protein
MGTTMATKPLDNHTYDVFKKAVMVTLPIMATLYIALASVFGWPHPEEIAGAITGVTAFLGTTLHFSSKVYNDQNNDSFAGTIDVNKQPDGGQKVMFAFASDEVAENLDKRDAVTFKVNVTE